MIKGHINGKYLAELRKAHNLTVEDVANRIGVSVSTYYKWESNHQSPSILKLQLLQLLYKDIDFNQLLSLYNVKQYGRLLEKKVKSND